MAARLDRAKRTPPPSSSRRCRQGGTSPLVRRRSTGTTRTPRRDRSSCAHRSPDEPAAHPEAYGVFFGGNNLDKDDQRYTYFLVRQDGQYLIKHRAGAETHTVVDWTAHPAVKAPVGGGEVANDLTVRAGRDTVPFLVNGQEVKAVPRASLQDVDGQVGLRINHNLDLHVAKFEVAKL